MQGRRDVYRVGMHNMNLGSPLISISAYFHIRNLKEEKMLQHLNLKNNEHGY